MSANCCNDLGVVETCQEIEIVEIGTAVFIADAVVTSRSFVPTAIDPGDNATILQAINFLLQAVRNLQNPPINPAVVTHNGQSLTYNAQPVTYTP